MGHFGPADPAANAQITERFMAAASTGDLEGLTALLAHRGERLEGVFLVEIADGRITDLYAVRNPDKLLAVTVRRRIGR